MTKKRVRNKVQTPTKPVVSPVLIGIVVAAAILIVAGLIWLGNQGGSTATRPADVSGFPALGNADASVTMIEFGDYG